MLILRTLAGSRAYGLSAPGSDWDYHEVFVTPTSELLSLGSEARRTRWEEKQEGADTQAWELGHFPIACPKCYNKADGKKGRPEQEQGQDLRGNLRSSSGGAASEKKDSSLGDQIISERASQLRETTGETERETVERGDSSTTLYDLQNTPSMAGKEVNTSTRPYRRGPEKQQARKSSDPLSQLSQSNTDVRTQPQCTCAKKSIDTQGWELGRFLFLATKCNPTVLETFVAPTVFNDSCPVSAQGNLAVELRGLLPYVLSRQLVHDAFRGYAPNQIGRAHA